MSHDIANRGEILLYSDENGREFVNVIFKDETFWLTQKAMSELFDCTTDNIARHLKNIFTDGELDKDSVTEKFSVTAADGKNYQTQHYDLNAIIAVAYRSIPRKRLDSASGRLKRSRSTSRNGFVLEKNDAQMLPLFRNWNDFDYHIDLSTCTNIPNGLQNATLTIRDPKSKKIVWTLSI